MAIGTGAAIAMGISAAAGAYGAKKQSDSADEATTAELQGTREALKLQEKMWEQRQADMSPYLSGGRRALDALDQMRQRPVMSFDANKPASWQPPAPLPWPQGPFPGPGGPAPGSPPPVSSWPTSGPGGPLGPQGAPSVAPPQGQLGAPMPGGGQGQTPANMVLMQAPDGEQRPVPRHLVAQFQQRGGKVIS